MRYWLAGAVLVLLPCAAQADIVYHHDIRNATCCLVIAHAGGGIEGNPYTNSEEAVLANLKTGARVFEIDFSPTRDGAWVGTHDWELWKTQTAHAGPLPPTYAEFAAKKLRARAGRYTGITIPFLEKTAALHRDTVIITDTKYDLRELARTLRNTALAQHVYVQAYSPADVDSLRALGFERIILTVYKMDLRNLEKLMGAIGPVSRKLQALTVPLDFFSRHSAALGRMGLPVYVHGAPESINSRELHHRFRGMGAAGFYLD